MAYNYFGTGSQVIGDLIAVVDPQLNTKIDFSDDQIDLVTSGSTVLSATKVGVSVTGSLLMSGTAFISEVDYIDFDVNASIPAYKNARLYYDTDTTDLAYYGSAASQTIQIGQQTVLKVKNSTGSPISKGKLVQIVGGVGDNPLINTASWENDANSANTLGMLMSTIAHDNFGYVLLNGILTGLNTNPATFTAGQVIYLSSSGDYTATQPVAPKHTVRLGEVIRAHATVGSVFVKIDNGYEIEELHNVLITSASTGDLLIYNSGSGLWNNTKVLSGSYSLTGNLSSTGIISGSTALFTTVTGSAYSGGSFAGTTVSGTTAQFTIISGSTITGSNITLAGGIFINPSSSGTGQAILVSGSNTIGGSTYIDFIRATNASAGAVTPTKTFRLNNSGSFEIVNSAYTTTIYTLDDLGNMITAGGMNISGPSLVGKMSERITMSSAGTGSVTFDTTNNSIFYNNGPTANITANFTNVSTVNDRVTSVTVILSQSATPRTISAVQINSTSSTINWANKTTPTPNANQHDIFGFSLIRSGSAWVTLGQMSTYG
jgi:uncharacterized membrane protein